MKFILSALLLLTSSTAFAMSQESFTECSQKNENNEQSLVGLLQILISETGDSAQQQMLIDYLGAEIEKTEVVTCLDAEAVLANMYNEGVKTKQSEAVKGTTQLTNEQFGDCTINNTNSVQTIYGLAQTVVAAGLVDGIELQTNLFKNPEVTSCLDAAAVLMDAYTTATVANANSKK